MNENTNQADNDAQEHDQDKPSKKKHAAPASEEEAVAAAAAAAAAAGNGADDNDDLSTQKKRSKKNAPIERVDAAVDGIMSGSPFSELQLSERTQKVKKKKRTRFFF